MQFFEQGGWGGLHSLGNTSNAGWWALSLKLLIPAHWWPYSARFQCRDVESSASWAVSQCFCSCWAVCARANMHSALADSGGPYPVQWQCRAAFGCPSWGEQISDAQFQLVWVYSAVGKWERERKDMHGFSHGVAWHKYCVCILFWWSWLQFFQSSSAPSLKTSKINPIQNPIGIDNLIYVLTEWH